MKNVDHELAPVVSEFLAHFGVLRLQQGKRHARVVHRLTGDFVPVAGSSGNHRARSNLTAQLRLLAASGQGFIARKTRRCLPLLTNPNEGGRHE